jgi:Amt family ammonium transporter
MEDRSQPFKPSNGKVWIQLVGAIFIILLNIIITSLIMLFIKYVLRIQLRMSPEELAIGDDAIHGEEAYVFGIPGAGGGNPAAPPRTTEDVENGGIGGNNVSDTESE